MINAAVKKTAEMLIDEGTRELNKNWENIEVDSYDPKCKLVYGVQDGKAYGYAVQEDFDDYVKYAKELRDMEGSLGKKDLWLGKIKWILPRAIHLDLIARGYPIQEMQESGDLYEIDCYVEDNCPELKTTKLFLKRQKTKKII